MYYILSVDKIYDIIISKNYESELKYYDNDRKADFYIEKIYQLIINEIPAALLNKVTQIIFHDNADGRVFNDDFKDAIRGNPKLGLDENHLNKLFSEYWVRKKEGNFYYKAHLEMNVKLDNVLLSTKHISIDVLKIKDIFTNGIVEVHDTKKLISDPQRYISTYMYLNELYELYENNLMMEHGLINYSINQRPLLHYLNEKLFNHFTSNKLDCSKVFILEEQDIAYKRLYPQLYTRYGNNIIVNDFSISRIENFNKKAYWLKNFQEISHREQVSLLSLFGTDAFSKKLIIVSSKAMQEETLVSNTFKENIYKIPVNLKFIDNISLLFLYMLNEKSSIAISELTDLYIKENKFALILKDVKTIKELEDIIRTLDTKFDFKNVNDWQNILENIYIRKVEKDTIDQSREENSFTDKSYKFFKKEGGFFKIVFAGKDVIIPKLDGLIYIQGILRYGERLNGINCTELFTLNTNAINNSNTSNVIIDPTDDLLNMYTKDRATTKKHTAEELRRLEKKKIKIEELIELCIEKHDIETVSDLENELKKIKTEKKNAINIHGRIRSSSTEDQNNYKKVSKAIKYSIDKTEKINKEFYKYLKKVIKYQRGNYIYKYQPIKGIDWVLDEDQ